MKRIVIGIAAAVAAMASAVVPSGAGQHFGVAGDLIAFPPSVTTSAMTTQAEPVRSTVEGFFAWGLVAAVTDDATGVGATAGVFTGCLSIVTAQGEDYGCVEEHSLAPVPTTDPMMRRASAQGSMPSRRRPGTMITFALTFESVSAPAPDADYASTGDPQRLRLMLRGGVATRVRVDGIVVSGAVGEVPVQTSGTWARGVVVDACDFHDEPCPSPGSP